MSTLARCLVVVVSLAVALVVTSPAQAQVAYSIDYQSPTKSAPDFTFGWPITEGDILFQPMLMPGGTPSILISAGVTAPPGPGLALPAYPNAVGVPPWFPGLVELDALSFGNDLLDDPMPPTPPFWPAQWCFSVDEFGIGLQFPPPPLPPNLSTEGPWLFPMPPPPGSEASADVFGFFPPGGFPPGISPVPPFAIPPGNVDVFDGDGFGPILPFGMGLIEPNMPTPGPPDLGDNIDAFDVDGLLPPGPGAGFPVYFSLDSHFSVFDPIEGAPNTGSAIANGPFVGGDVLVSPAPGAPPVVYAPAFMLGLDLVGPPDSDDLDALILGENGDGIFQPTQNLYDWMTGSSDMLFFSVRRGSAIIGVPDFFLGIPITEGDILFPPPNPGMPPGIWICGENLGLCIWRPGFPPPPCPPMPWGPFSDDINALDLVQDCDDDGIPDAIAIFTGISTDNDGDGIPDNCMPQPQTFKRGDCNVDNLFGLTDAIFLLNYLFIAGSPTPTCDDACDVNDDGLLSLPDVIFELSFLFVPGSPSPPAPYPNCGPDPSLDGFGCATFFPFCP